MLWCRDSDRQVPLYMHNLTYLDLRHNHLIDVPISMGDMLMRQPPLQLLLSFNPLTGLNDMGFQMGSPDAVDDLPGTVTHSYVTAMLQAEPGSRLHALTHPHSTGDTAIGSGGAVASANHGRIIAGGDGTGGGTTSTSKALTNGAPTVPTSRHGAAPPPSGTASSTSSSLVMEPIDLTRGGGHSGVGVSAQAAGVSASRAHNLKQRDRTNASGPLNLSLPSSLSSSAVATPAKGSVVISAASTAAAPQVSTLRSGPAVSRSASGSAVDPVQHRDGRASGGRAAHRTPVIAWGDSVVVEVDDDDLDSHSVGNRTHPVPVSSDIRYALAQEVDDNVRTRDTSHKRRPVYSTGLCHVHCYCQDRAVVTDVVKLL